MPLFINPPVPSYPKEYFVISADLVPIDLPDGSAMAPTPDFEAAKRIAADNPGTRVVDWLKWFAEIDLVRQRRRAAEEGRGKR
jgi:hypothetical protein